MIYYLHSTTQDERSRSNINSKRCPTFPLINKEPLPLSITLRLRYNTIVSCESVETEEQRFERILTYHRERIGQYRSEWEYRADSR